MINFSITRVTILLFFSSAILLPSFSANSQDLKNDLDSIKSISKIWDNAFNDRDTSIYYKYVTNTFSMTVGGGTSTGIESFKNGTNALFKNRPDIIFVMRPATIEVNKQWSLAYDTGEWIESWTESTDLSKSKITGKYWRMWRKINNEWIIMSIIFTPLTCAGSYCD